MHTQTMERLPYAPSALVIPDQSWAMVTEIADMHTLLYF